MTKSMSLGVLVVLLATAGFGSALKSGEFKMKGRVIARDYMLGMLLLNPPQNAEIFLVREAGSHAKQAASRFIVIRYIGFDPNLPMPAGLMDGTRQWKFTGTRNTECDVDVVEGMYFVRNNASDELPSGRFLRTDDAGSDLLVVGSRLPCFDVEPRGLKRVN